ncbi:MAG: Gfo/Idh/MocA family oxidoreductase, partial [Candidatus Kapaibacteriota bacterium]
RDIIFYFKLVMVPTLDDLPELKRWMPNEAALSWACKPSTAGGVAGNVFGKKGSAYINPFKVVKKVDSTVQVVQPEATKSQLAVYKKSYETEFRHFVSGVRGIIPMISTIDEAVERMKIIEAMYASAELKREIVIP